MHESEEDVRRRIVSIHSPHEQVAVISEFVQRHYRNKPQVCVRLAADVVVIAQSTSDKAVIANSLVWLARCKSVLNEYAESLSLYQEAEGLFAEIESVEGRLHTLDGIGQIYRIWGQHEQAISKYMEELELAEVYGFKENVISALSGLGYIYSQASDYGKALEFYQRSLVLREQSEDNQDIASIYAHMGDIYHRLGKYERGLEFFNKCLALCKGKDDLHMEARMLQNIGASLCHLMEYEKAEESSHRAMKIFEELRDRAGKARCFVNLGAIYQRLEDLDKAREYFQQAWVLAEEIGDNEITLVVWYNIGDICVRKKEYTQGIEFFLQALSMAKKSGARQIQCTIYSALSTAYEEIGQLAEALEYHKRFSAMYNDLLGREKNMTIHEIQYRFHVERLENEKEIYRLRNVELAKALTEVGHLNADLKRMDIEKNELLGIVAHDLKSPISNVLMLAQLLRRESDSLSPEDIHEFSNDIVITANRMLELIVNLLDVHAVESGSLKLALRAFDIVSEFSPVLYMYREQAMLKNIDLLFESPSSVMVFADYNAATRILDNLVSNAVKYSPANTAIHVTIEVADAVVRCSVRDEGPGLSEEDKEKLFGKFARLSAQPTGGEHSTGLGLSIVKRLVEAMNGKVWCESEWGKGATFWVELPRARSDK